VSNRNAIAILAAIVLAAGIAVGFWPSSIDRAYRDSEAGTTVSCGSAFTGVDREAHRADLGSNIREAYTGVASGGHVEECDDKLAARLPIALVTAGVGALGLLWFALTASTAQPPRGRGPASSETTPTV
jgi:hypothetical protein